MALLGHNEDQKAFLADMETLREMLDRDVEAFEALTQFGGLGGE